jgi:predicted dehydrogenase
MAEKPGALVICTPPALHTDYVKVAAERNLHVFAEVPFLLDPALLADVARRAPGSAVLGVSGTIRFWPPFRIIRDLIHQGAIGRPLYAECSLGNHIAEWHPYEDYRNFYGSDFDLGGAGMDMVYHDLSPVEWWLGGIETVHARFSKVSNLDVKGPDMQDILFTCESGCRGFFHNDIVEHGTIGRHVRIAGETGTIEWRQNDETVRLYEAKAKAGRNIPFSDAADWEQAIAASREMGEILARQKMKSGQIPSVTVAKYTYEANYLREMKHFADAVTGKSPYTLCTIQEELRTVRTVAAIVRSSREHREIRIEE